MEGLEAAEGRWGRRRVTTGSMCPPSGGAGCPRKSRDSASDESIDRHVKLGKLLLFQQTLTGEEGRGSVMWSCVAVQCLASDCVFLPFQKRKDDESYEIRKREKIRLVVRAGERQVVFPQCQARSLGLNLSLNNGRGLSTATRESWLCRAVSFWFC